MRTRLAAAFFAVAALAMAASVAPALAYTPYHTVRYTPPKDAVASATGVVPSPTLDVTGVSYGYDGTHLRFTMNLTDADAHPPTGFQEQDFFWRFSYGNGSGTVHVVVSLQRFDVLGHSWPFVPDYIGTTTNGADTLNSCRTCYATIDVPRKQVLFYATLDDLNSAISQASATAVGVHAGTVLHPIEADTQADIGPGIQSFPADVAPAPKNLTFTV